MIEDIIIFAAGKGTRMKEQSIHTPKPLIKVLNKPILEHNLDLILLHPFKRIFINVHYLASQIIDFIDDYIIRKKPKAEIILIHEDKLLENGGTVKAIANKIMLSNKIFVMNGDVIFNSSIDIFQYMEEKLKDRTDFLLLIQPTNKATNYNGKGDFNVTKENKIISDIKGLRSHIYTGLQILRPKVVNQYPAEIFKLYEFFTNNYNTEVLEIDDLNWYHLSEPDDIKNTEIALLKINH